jgi:phosphoglycolate phosphatase
LVCPGVRPVLSRLRSRGLATGLVTGNLSRIGWKKMERAGLKEYFQFGAFAELALDRAALIRHALRQARERGWIGRDSRLWYIGDHPNDIRAARANGVRVAAVATGMSSEAELSAHAPDLLLSDLRGLKLETLLTS